MLGGDESLEPVALDEGGGTCRDGGEQGERLGDLVVVPPGPVLVGQEDEPAVGSDPGVAAGVLEEQEREQCLEDDRAGALGEGDPHQADGLARQLGAQEVGSGTGRVAGGEGEVGRLRHRLEALGQDGGVGDRERDPRRDDLLLAAGDPRGDGRLGHEEEPGDVGRRHADDEAQREGARDLRGEGGVAAHEDEPQPLVLDEVAGVGHGGRRPPPRLDDEEGRPAQRHRLRPQPVDDPAAGGRHQPGARAVGGAVARPPPGRGLDRIAEGVLDEVEAAELREEQGHQASPLLAHRGRRGPRQRSRGGS